MKARFIIISATVASGELLYYVAHLGAFKMIRLLLVFLVTSFAFCQNAPPAGNRVEWDPAAPGASKDLPDGRSQRTASSANARVSALPGVAPARRLIDPTLDGGDDITFVGIAIHNTSNQPVRIDPSNIALRAVGKKERELKRMTEEQVAMRAWHSNGPGAPSALPAMSGSMAGSTGGDASIQTAVAQQEQRSGQRAHPQWSEKNTGLQAAQLKERALPAKELQPGEQIMGLVFFAPYEAKDKVELSIPVGETTFVIPFSGPKAKK